MIKGEKFSGKQNTLFRFFSSGHIILLVISTLHWCIAAVQVAVGQIVAHHAIAFLLFSAVLHCLVVLPDAGRLEVVGGFFNFPKGGYSSKYLLEITICNNSYLQQGKSFCDLSTTGRSHMVPLAS